MKENNRRHLRNCPICNKTAAGEAGMKNSYLIEKCNSCAHLFSRARLSEEMLKKHYFHYSYETNDLHHTPEFVFTRLNEIVRTFEPYRHSNRLLDVGFGAGAMLKIGHEKGWKVYGLEFSNLAVRQAIENGFTNVIEGDIFDVPFKDDFFDVIVATEIIEHLPDPFLFLNQAHRLLSPGGLLYITTPNSRGLSSKILGLNWSVVQMPEHLNIFSPLSIRLALKSCGFLKIKMNTEGLNPYEIIHFFQHRHPSNCDKEVHFDRVRSSYSLNEALMNNRAGLLAKRFINTLLRKTSLGDSLKIFAIKS